MIGTFILLNTQIHSATEVQFIKHTEITNIRIVITNMINIHYKYYRFYSDAIYKILVLQLIHLLYIVDKKLIFAQIILIFIFISWSKVGFMY